MAALFSSLGNIRQHEGWDSGQVVQPVRRHVLQRDAIDAKGRCALSLGLGLVAQHLWQASLIQGIGSVLPVQSGS